MDFTPICYSFCECKSDRIGQNIQNEVLLERSVFEEVNVYQFIPCKQRPSIFLDKSGRPEERCVTRQKTATILEPQTNPEFRETSVFYIHHSRVFREMIYFSIYFSRNIAATIRTTANATTNSTCIYKLSEVKFLGDKKRPTKGFYLEVWKIDSAVFLYQV